MALKPAFSQFCDPFPRLLDPCGSLQKPTSFHEYVCPLTGVSHWNYSKLIGATNRRNSHELPQEQGGIGRGHCPKAQT